MKKKNKIVIQALNHHKVLVIDAYEKYTKEVIASAESHNPTTNNAKFDDSMRSIKARLSGRKAHAVKTSRSIIIEHYLPELSAANDLNMSTREAIEAITITCGRCVSKNKLVGLFTRSGEGRYSPFFTDDKYKKSVLNHPIFIALGDDIKAFNSSIPHTENHLKEKLLSELENYK
ncbi:TPA: hypothetical protein ACOLZF_004619 [Vibrio parahaemolyticus]